MTRSAWRVWVATMRRGALPAAGDQFASHGHQPKAPCYARCSVRGFLFFFPLLDRFCPEQIQPFFYFDSFLGFPPLARAPRRGACLPDWEVVRTHEGTVPQSSVFKIAPDFTVSPT